MCRLFDQSLKVQKLLIGLILIVNHCDGIISTIEIRRLKEGILLLPIIIKGTDSRIGFGFKLGRHADYQTIFEVGPQKFTKPFGTNVEDSPNANKRMIDGFKYSNQIKKQSNAYRRTEKWKNDIISLEIHSKSNTFGTTHQFPLPPQPIDLTQKVFIKSEKI